MNQFFSLRLALKDLNLTKLAGAIILGVAIFGYLQIISDVSDILLSELVIFTVIAAYGAIIITLQHKFVASRWALILSKVMALAAFLYAMYWLMALSFI